MGKRFSCILIVQVMSTKASLAASLSDYTNQQPEDAPALGYPNHFPPLSNGYCQDTASILEAENLDLLSPLLALEHTEAFPVVRAFLDHIFTQFKMLDELQRPDSCLVLTEPSNLPLSVKELLLRYLFEEVQLTRLCLLPKALAISLLFEEETCVVVDSGATSTAVWVVLEGRVDPARTRTAPVGGWHVSQFLSQALAWKEREEGVVATPSSLDTNTVKQKCRLSLNLSREEHRAAPPRTETLHVRSQRGGGRGGQHRAGVGSGPAEYTEINLSSELFLAPEMMYASLDLAGMILEATRDLPPHNLKDCFSHILIQGGNTDLQVGQTHHTVLMYLKKNKMLTVDCRGSPRVCRAISARRCPSTRPLSTCAPSPPGTTAGTPQWAPTWPLCPTSTMTCCAFTSPARPSGYPERWGEFGIFYQCK